jgi:hypothetical protein
VSTRDVYAEANAAGWAISLKVGGGVAWRDASGRRVMETTAGDICEAERLADALDRHYAATSVIDKARSIGWVSEEPVGWRPHWRRRDITHVVRTASHSWEAMPS